MCADHAGTRVPQPQIAWVSISDTVACWQGRLGYYVRSETVYSYRPKIVWCSAGNRFEQTVIVSARAVRCAQAIAEWDAKAAARDAEYAKVSSAADGDNDTQHSGREEEPAFVAYVPLPEQQEIEARVS